MTARNESLFSQLPLTFQIFCECFPLLCPFYMVALYLLVVEELRRVWIAVIEIIAIINDFSVLNLATAEYEVIEYLITNETDKGTGGKEHLVAKTEFHARKQAQLLVKRLLHVVETQFTGIHIEPFDVIFSEEHILRISN